MLSAGGPKRSKVSLRALLKHVLVIFAALPHTEYPLRCRQNKQSTGSSQVPPVTVALQFASHARCAPPRLNPKFLPSFHPIVSFPPPSPSPCAGSQYRPSYVTFLSRPRSAVDESCARFKALAGPFLTIVLWAAAQSTQKQSPNKGQKPWDLRSRIQPTLRFLGSE